MITNLGAAGLESGSTVSSARISGQIWVPINSKSGLEWTNVKTINRFNSGLVSVSDDQSWMAKVSTCPPPISGTACPLATKTTLLDSTSNEQHIYAFGSSIWCLVRKLAFWSQLNRRKSLFFGILGQLEIFFTCPWSIKITGFNFTSKSLMFVGIKSVAATRPHSIDWKFISNTSMHSVHRSDV